MLAAGGGSIVNIVSVAAARGAAGRAAYAATLDRLPHICMLHQRRVPFLLVS